MNELKKICLGDHLVVQHQGEILIKFDDYHVIYF